MKCFECMYYEPNKTKPFGGFCHLYGAHTFPDNKCSDPQINKNKLRMKSTLVWYKINALEPIRTEHVFVFGTYNGRNYISDAIYQDGNFYSYKPKGMRFEGVKLWASMPPIKDSWIKE